MTHKIYIRCLGFCEKCEHTGAVPVRTVDSEDHRTVNCGSRVSPFIGHEVLSVQVLSNNGNTLGSLFLIFLSFRVMF